MCVYVSVSVCVCVCVCVCVAQSCPTLCNPMDCSLPGFSVHGILQAGVLEWVAIPVSIINAEFPLLSIFCNRSHMVVSCTMCPAHIYIHPEFQSVDLFGRRVFADVIKDPEMKSSWI